MIFKPLNDFMIISSLKSTSWDSILVSWLNKNYPEINLKNDSNLWEVCKQCNDIIDVYKQLKSFLNSEISEETNITRLKNLVCINCFGINIESTDYLLEDMQRYLYCFSNNEKYMYNCLSTISSTDNRDVLLSYNEQFESNSLSAISNIRKTLKTNYKRLLVDSIEVKGDKFNKSPNGIMIHYLKDEPFQLIVGSVSSGKINSANSFKKKNTFKSYLENLRTNLGNNPGVLSANLVNDYYIGLFDEGEIIFGYEYIPVKRILGMNTGDCFIKKNKKLIVDDLYFDKPDSLLKHMSSNAVEILINMQPEPIVPSYIISIDQIKENDIDAAKILRLPIYVIDSKICYEKRKKHEDGIIKDLDKREIDIAYLIDLVKLYKYQEQSFLIDVGYFKEIKSEIISRLDITYNKLGKIIKNIYNSCILDTNLSIQARLDNMEKLMILNTVITDISLASSLNNKRSGNDKDFLCFFTEYSSHSEFMNSIINKIENMFSTKISTYALICLASLKCNLQDYNLKICYEEFNQQACEYLKLFKFEFIDLVLEGAFRSIYDYSLVKCYNDKDISLLMEDNVLRTILYQGINFDIVAVTNNISKLSNVKTSYICKNLNNKEIEVQLLKNGNIRVLGDHKKIIHKDNIKNIDNKEYVINK